MKIKPVGERPSFRAHSPEVVRTLDQIRFALDEQDARNSSPDHAEFTWFAREYPRCYRYHLGCADFRLKTIWSLYQEVHSNLSRDCGMDESTVQIAISNEKVYRIYWDFESFLSEINIALDLLARVAGTAYKDEMPVSFNRFCKKEGNAGLLGIMKRAQSRWVRGLKDYRDCFIHYTPVDTLLSISLVRRADEFEIRAEVHLCNSFAAPVQNCYQRRLLVGQAKFGSNVARIFHMQRTALSLALADLILTPREYLKT
jgi:hypothetical protein